MPANCVLSRPAKPADIQAHSACAGPTGASDASRARARSRLRADQTQCDYHNESARDVAECSSSQVVSQPTKPTESQPLIDKMHVKLLNKRSTREARVGSASVIRTGGEGSDRWLRRGSGCEGRLKSGPSGVRRLQQTKSTSQSRCSSGHAGSDGPRSGRHGLRHRHSISHGGIEDSPLLATDGAPVLQEHATLLRLIYLPRRSPPIVRL